MNIRGCADVLTRTMAARSTFKISDAVRDVLARSTITADRVVLPDGQLERKLYTDVNKALEGAGGRWSRKDKAHVFDRDPREVLGLAVETGKATNVRTKLQAFYTPAPLADRVVAAAVAAGCIKHGSTVLEPSAGEGALALAAIRRAAVSVTMYDIDEVVLARAHEVTSKAVADSGGSVCAGLHDFLHIVPAPTYDAVLMNPPFTNGADIAHVTHAWQFVRPGGALVAITSTSWRDNKAKAAVTFRKLIETTRATVEDIPGGTFKHTDIATLMVIMRKAG